MIYISKKLINNNNVIITNIVENDIFSGETTDNNIVSLSKIKNNKENNGTIRQTGKKVIKRISNVIKNVFNPNATRKRLRVEGGKRTHKKKPIKNKKKYKTNKTISKNKRKYKNQSVTRKVGVK